MPTRIGARSEEAEMMRCLLGSWSGYISAVEERSSRVVMDERMLRVFARAQIHDSIKMLDLS